MIEIVFEEAKEYLYKIANNELVINFPILIFANKQDLPKAVSVSELVNLLDLPFLGRPWYIQGCCATSGDGLYEGFEWLAMVLNVNKIS